MLAQRPRRMKILAIRIVLWALIAVLGYLIVDVIYQDIHFAAVKARKETARVIKMEKIRELQFAYKDEHRKFAKKWDELLTYARDGKITVVKTIGDPRDTTQEVTRDTTYLDVAQEIFNGDRTYIDSLPYIPYSAEKKQFELDADKINLRNVLVDVFELRDADPIFQDPERTEEDPDDLDDDPLTIGSMSQGNFDLNRDPRNK